MNSNRTVIGITILGLFSTTSLSAGFSTGDYVNMYQQISGTMAAERAAAEAQERQEEAERQRKEQQEKAAQARKKEAQARAEEDKARRELQELQAQEALFRKVPAYRPDYAGEPCYFFNRPTLEETPRGTRQNIHAEGAWVCHHDVLYQCRDTKWMNRGECSQWGTLQSRLALQSHTVEGVVVPVPPPKPKLNPPAPAQQVSDAAAGSKQQADGNPFR